NVGEPPRQEQRQEPRQEQRQEPRQEQRQEQRAEPRLEPRKPMQPATPPSPPPYTAAGPGDAGAGRDQTPAQTVHRRAAALRTHPGEARARGSQARPQASAEQAPRSDSLPAPPPRIPRASDQRPATTETNKPNQGKTAIYDTLEQEMANLLGRPSKT